MPKETGKLEKKYALRRNGVMKAAIKEHGTEAIHITHTPDIYYLTGCREGASGLLMGQGWATIFTSKMFAEVIPEQAPGIDVRIPEKDLFTAITDLLRAKKHRRSLGFQGSQMTWAQHQAFSKAMNRRKLISIGDVVLNQRSVKDEDEIKLIRKCVRIAEKAFSELMQRGLSYFIGKTEKALATELEYLMRQMGADRQGFPVSGTIVASGPNSASCHHLPTMRKIRRNEPLLFDWGAELDGYRSDITRTLFMGSVPGRFDEIYNLVLAAHDSAVAAMRPGVRLHTVAKKGWDVIREAGYGDTIRHGLGHGIGLEIHERPFFASRPTSPGAKAPALRKGMIMTVEPGIYFKGEGGVRIEDDILVTASGHKRLNTLSRSLKDMVIS